MMFALDTDLRHGDIGITQMDISSEDKKKLKRLIKTAKQFQEIYENTILLVQMPPEVLIEDCQISERLYTCISLLRTKRDEMFKALKVCEHIF